jgi:HNH endonuclease family protein
LRRKRVIINGEETRYEVSDTGIVFSINKSGKEKILKHFITDDGYHRVVIHLHGVKYTKQVHRLVAMAFIPNPENKPQVNHINGNKDINTVENLEWNTPKENIEHAWAHGLSHPAYCENHPNAVYTDEQIHNVCKELVRNQLTMMEIGEKTGVTYTVVKQIRSHVIWNNISSQYDFSHYNRTGRGRRFTEDQIRSVCTLLEDRSNTTEDVCHKSGMQPNFVRKLALGLTHTDITSDYTFTTWRS